MKKKYWFIQSIIIILILLLLFSFIYAVIQQEIWWSIFSFGMIGIALIPTILRRVIHIDLPYLFDVIICLALLFHMGNGLYDGDVVIPFYNKFTHFFSSAVVAFIILLLLFIFNEYYRGIAVNTGKIIFDVIVSTMAFGVIWEFMEWTGDFFFHFNAQPGLTDTMGDLFADMLGGIFIAGIGYILIKRNILRRFSTNFKIHFPDLIDDE